MNQNAFGADLPYIISNLVSKKTKSLMIFGYDAIKFVG